MLDSHIRQTITQHQAFHDAAGQHGFGFFFVVITLQNCCVVAQLLFHRHFFAHVAHDANEKPMTVKTHFRDRQFSGDRRAILMDRLHLPLRQTDDSGQTTVNIGLNIVVVMPALRFRHQHADVLAQQFVGFVAKNYRYHGIDRHNDAEFVDGDDTIGDIVGNGFGASAIFVQATL